MVYDPQHPIDGIFIAIDELVNYSEAAEAAYSQPQCINLAYRILNKTGLFQRWILDWNNRPAIQKTWTNFKIHFRRAHQQLKETGNLQARNSVYHANAIKEALQEFRTELQAHRQENSTRINDQDSVPTVTSFSDNSTSNSTISDLQTEVASLKDYIHNMQPSLAYQQPITPWIPPPYCMPINPFQGYANQASPYPYQQPMGQQPPNNQRKRRIFYCWTHGACFHPGVKCRNKAPGHQDAATFSNRMNGSIKNVRGVPQEQANQTNS